MKKNVYFAKKSTMNIFGKIKIEQFITKHAITKNALENWIGIVV